MNTATTATPAAPPSRSVVGVSLAIARDIKLSHSVFALPFAVLAACMAAAWAGAPPTWPAMGLIVLCMVFARTTAMTVNRWADAQLDARNPRTAGRAVPAGRVSSRAMAGAAALSAAAFILAAWGFWWLNANPWPGILSPLVLAWLAGYSFTKRFTVACHLVLGAALAMSPVAAAIAIAPGYLAQPAVWLLALMVACWVAGFDVIYALQDVAVDREAGLHSMPSRLGVEPSLWISRLLHLITAVALAATGWFSPLLGSLFAVAVVLVAGLLIIEHALVWRSENRRIPLAFLTVNGVISLLLGAMGVLDVLMRIP